MENKFVSAIILAAGSGSRMGNDKTKQQISVLGKSVLKRSVEAFQQCDFVSEIIVVTRVEEMDFARNETEQYSKVTNFVLGGRTRAESAANGFLGINENADFVAIHDAARCLVSVEDIGRVITDAFVYGAATASYKATDTIKMVNDEGFVVRTCDRAKTVHVLTPQVFSKQIYEKALKATNILDTAITDDNMLVEGIGVYPYCTQTSRDNVKIKYNEDIAYAEYVLKGRVND